MVLPARIELATSALPRMRSTTELRQHCFPTAATSAVREGPICLGTRDCQPASCRFIAFRMKDVDKQARLAEKLRENLRRRKAQARGVKAEGAGQGEQRPDESAAE